MLADDEELKMKYESSGKNKNGKLVKLIIAVLMVVVACAAVIYFSPPKNMTIEAVLAELEAINAGEDVKNVVEVKKCGLLSKSGQEWTISGCEGGMVIYLTIDPVWGNAMRVCGGWADGREVVQKANDVLDALYMTDVKCDAESVVLLEERSDGKKKYDMCGLNLFIREGCIV